MAAAVVKSNLKQQSAQGKSKKLVRFGKLSIQTHKYILGDNVSG